MTAEITDAGSAAPPPPPGVRKRRWLWWSLAFVLFALLALGATVATLLGSERGQHSLLSRLPGVTIIAPQGAVTGGAFKAQRIDIQASARRITLHEVQWQDLQWQWRPHPGAWVGITIASPTVRRVEVGAAPPGPAAAVPRSLRLPFALVLNEARIDELQIAGAPPLRQLQATLALGEAQGSLHRITRATVQTEAAQVALFGTVAADPPFATTASGELNSAAQAATPWQGRVQLQGPLDKLDTRAQLSSSRTQGASASATLQLTPFATWPLGALDLKLQDLDLSTLSAQLPQTLLSGEATVNTAARDAPIDARIALVNAKPGRWDAKALPVQRLSLQARGVATDRSRLEVPQFEALLHAGAGSVRGSGTWQAHEANLQLQLTGLQPAALDARAAALTAGGRGTLRVQGLPSPDGKAAPDAKLVLQADVDLQGQLDAPPRQSVRLQSKALVQREPFNGTAQKQWRIEFNELQLRSAGALAEGQLQATLLPVPATPTAQTTPRWTLRSEGRLSDFDPSAWWRSPTALPPATINARWRADLQRDGARTQGQAELTLADSRVGGVPTSGQAQMQSRGADWAVNATLQAADNRVQAQGTVSPTGAQDRWTVQVDAPTLAALAPLARSLPPSLLPAAAREHLPTAGSMAGTLELDGRWPQLKTAGKVQLQGFASPRSQLQQLQAQWQAGPDVQAPLAVSLQAQGLALQQAKVETLSLRAEGTVAAHQVQFSADTPLKPPAALQTLAPSVANSNGSRFTLDSSGRFDRGTMRWQSTSQLSASSRGGGSGIGDTTPWLTAQDLALSAQFDARGRLSAVQAAGGKSQLGGPQGAALLWREARWTPDTGTARGELKLDVELQPLAATPLLDRLLPQAGFGGDLAVKGSITLQASDKFAADVVLERERGDLFVRDEGQTQTLGLTDLRVGFVANEGVWHFTQAVAGANLGVLVGATSMRLPATARWPAPTTPMEGVLEWQVADMGIWARFMPPGWRLGGKLRTSAAIGGQFGAPEVRGEMVGQGLAVRNLLQGVDVRDGELTLTLAGPQAKIERFVFKGGDGELRVSGGATLGATPSAKLALAADKFRVLGRIDRRIVTSGQAELALAADKLSLSGRLAVDEGLIDVSRGDAPSLDNDVTVRRRAPEQKDTRATDEEPEAKAPTASRRPPGAPRDLSLAVAIDLGKDLKLRGRGLDTRLEGQLNLTAPGGRMAVNGTVRAVDGTYAAYGQKLDIERGVLVFNGTVENPRLDIFAVRPNLDVRVGVQVVGTAQAPRVRLSSEPEMSEFDKLSWLVLGRAGDGLGRPDTALLQRAALALLSGPDATGSGSPLSTLGLDDFSVRQTGEGDVRNTVVSLGKQLSRRWYLGYERGVNSTTGTWQLIYRAAQRFTLRAQSGEENALDAIWTWRWN